VVENLWHTTVVGNSHFEVVADEILLLIKEQRVMEEM